MHLRGDCRLLVNPDYDARVSVEVSVSLQLLHFRLVCIREYGRDFHAVFRFGFFRIRIVCSTQRQGGGGAGCGLGRQIVE